MAKRKMYSFEETRHSQRGITSTVLGIVALLVFLILIYVAAYYEGNGGAYLGSIGIAAMILTIYGLVCGLRSFQEKNKIYTFSKIGSILNGVLIAGWIGLILLGVE